ncbi:MAG: hypothetical protein QXU54_00935 [Candidatus Micrarchaeia archaeon]
MSSTVFEWTELALMGITLAYLIAVIIYMLSYIISSELMRAWARNEIQNLIFTLILFATLGVLASLDFVSGKDTGYINEGEKYLGTLYNDSIACTTSIMQEVNTYSILGSVSVGVGPELFAVESITPATSADSQKVSGSSEVLYLNADALDKVSNMGLGFSLAPFISPINTMVSQIMQYLTIPLGMMQLHILLISLIKKHGVTVFLPVGVLLRAFKFSRNAGNLIIALFIALYFILPAAYLFNKNLMKEALDEYKDTICGDGAPSMFGEVLHIYAKSSNLGYGINPDIDVDVGQIIDKPLTYGGSAFKKVILRIGIEGTMLPFFAIVLTLGIAREFAATLGSDIDFSQLVRVV